MYKESYIQMDSPGKKLEKAHIDTTLARDMAQIIDENCFINCV
jgi:hypothetical protein